MNLIALDLSLCATGMATYSEPGVLVSTLKVAGTGDDRRRGMLEACKEAIIHRDVVVVEGIAFSRNDPSAQERAWLWYSVYDVVSKNRDKRLWVVSPSALKKFVTGSGVAKKEHMLLEVFARWGIRTANNNEADGVGLLYLGMALEGLWKPTTQQQREVVAMLNKKRAA